jgi:hypothetical protein
MATTIVDTDYGAAMAQYRPARGSESGNILDARLGKWRQNQSLNANPTEFNNCLVGTDTPQANPVVIRDMVGVTFWGGTFEGVIPRHSDWEWTYMSGQCGGVAVLLEDCSDGIVQGVYIDQCWDAFKFIEGAKVNGGGGWLLKDCYAKDVRDDCLEDDDILGGTVSNCMFDGALVGYSSDGSGTEDGTGVDLFIENSFIRLQPAWVNGTFRHFQAFKPDMTSLSPPTSATLVLNGNVFCYPTEGDNISRWEYAMENLVDIARSGNNTIIWASDDAVPTHLSDTYLTTTVPGVFNTTRVGKAAGEALWAKHVAEFKVANGFTGTTNLLPTSFTTGA